MHRTKIDDFFRRKKPRKRAKLIASVDLVQLEVLNESKVVHKMNELKNQSSSDIYIILIFIRHEVSEVHKMKKETR
jgi:hypothetical protein